MAKGPRGPRPLPTHLKLLRGNPGHQVLNKSEPQPMQSEHVPDVPEFLIGQAANEWRRIAPELHRLRLLTVVDINALAAYCQAYGYWRQAIDALAKMAERDPLTSGLMVKSKNGHPMQNPLFLTAKQAGSDMVRYAAEFGLTAAARSRITVGSSTEGRPSKFDGLLAS